MHRRDFLALTGTSALAAPLGIRWPAPRPRLLPPPGIQLYSLRAAMKESVERTLDRVAEIGYREVEFAGWFDRSAAEVAATLRATGLVAPAAHVPLESLEGAELARTAAFAAEAGHRGLIVAWVAPELRPTLEAWRRLGDRFNDIGSALSAWGLRFGYHNHDFEFTPMNGRMPFDVLLESTNPALVGIELDLYWVLKGGQNPFHLVRRLGGRVQLVHVKDSGGPPDHAMVNPGDGIIDFRTILQDQPGIIHAFAEHDNPADPWEFARAALAAWRGFGG